MMKPLTIAYAIAFSTALMLPTVGISQDQDRFPVFGASEARAAFFEAQRLKKLELAESVRQQSQQQTQDQQKSAPQKPRNPGFSIGY